MQKAQGVFMMDTLQKTLRKHKSIGMNNKKQLLAEQSEELLSALKGRFEKNMNRHKGIEWAKVQAKLEANPEKLWSLDDMEQTGGEPDVVGQDKKTGEYMFFDCSADKYFFILFIYWLSRISTATTVS